MPKTLESDKIFRSDIRTIVSYIENWSIRTGAAWNVSFERKMDEALAPNNVRELIRYIARLEESERELLRCEEQLQRVAHKCYGKCQYYDIRYPGGENI